MKKINMNKKTIYGLLLGSIFAMWALLICFYYEENKQIRNRATTAIMKTYQNRYYEAKRLPGTWLIYLEPSGDDFLMDFEEDLVNHYNKNKAAIPYQKVQLYKKNGRYLYYMVVKNKEERLIIYADVSVSKNVIHNSMSVMVVALLVSFGVLWGIFNMGIKKLNQKDKALKNFFANASHEMKTPLTAISGNVDGIRQGYVSKEQALTVIEKEVDRMSTLIKSILELSQLDSGVQVMRKEDNDVREILYDAISSIEPQAQNNNLNIEVHLPNVIFRSCDEGMLYSAFSNILSNDVRFAKSTIWVYTERMDNDKVKIIFENDGEVISEQDKRHVFDRFYKGERGQYGIGMALAQEYIKLHQTEIKVLTRNQRTVFEIEL
ncbi:MAG: HAMP domain-containing histidine kinase [Lachnospiraceae bacterium]|nr:HAMP domain-containing histidine kinase [Lachnospiraceae bacterium]